ncbi:hypothetical protein KKB40_03285 [Patescibacteria group bacterium]|nr:hypothetical protein [Patescibacteria group bacterium]
MINNKKTSEIQKSPKRCAFQLLLISCVSIFMCTAIFAAEKSTDKELWGNRGIGAKGYMVGAPPGEVPQTLASPKMLTEEALQGEQGEEGGVTYTVKKNDSLWHMAGRQYGDPNKWPVTYRANKNKLNLFLQNLNALTTFSVIFLIFFAVVLLTLVIIKKGRQNDISTRLDEMYSKIHNDINFAVVPKSINLSPSADDLIQSAVEVWRIEQRLVKLQAILPENSKKGIENSV